MKKQAMLAPVKVPDIQHTLPEVFIFESLNIKDEAAKRFEGQILADMLRLSGKNPKYFYFQSPEELPHLLGLFRESKYRYLHISAHASSTQIATTTRNLSYEEFSSYFSGHLKLRRLFFSACQVGNKHFVEKIAEKNKGIHSVVAPAENIRFSDAAAIWASFYLSMFKVNLGAMKQTEINRKFQALTMLFPVEFYYAAYKAKTDSWEHTTFRGGQQHPQL